ncbi:manganese efflux pump MntP family protein, partial [Herbaspirillum sp.]|uniref:manganese efflux pump MntP n=1 Tax=Herbaspirillum sp. TaxID=1890675 RepID=UPI002580D984
MNFPALLLLALAMSTDAFAAAIGKGAAMQKPRFLQALRIGLLFGVIEAITPLIGWFAGSVATKWVSEWDHWIAFVLLLVLGARMIREGLSDDDEEEDANATPQKQSVVMLALTAVATSIDAMAVGNLTADQAREQASLIRGALTPRLTRDDIPTLAPLEASEESTVLHPHSTREESLVLRYLQ